MLKLIAILNPPSTASIWIRNRRPAGSSRERGGGESAGCSSSPQEKLPTGDHAGGWSVICLTTTSYYLTTWSPEPPAMDMTAYFGRPSDPLATARGARVRRLLLEQVRYALTTEPAALQLIPEATPDSLTHIRGRVSITVWAIG